MTYPKTIAEFLSAARNWTPPQEISEAYYTSVYGSPVTASTSILSLLKARDDLDNDGLKVLVGAAHIIAEPHNQWHGRGAEAASVVAARASEIA